YKFSFDIGFNSSFQANIRKADSVRKRFSRYFTTIPNIKWRVIRSEDLVQSSLVGCEKTLTHFITLLGFNTSASMLKNIIEYDSHQFISDATWWDQSKVAENIVTMSLPPRPSTF